MSQPSITIIIEDKPYKLGVGDVEAIGRIPSEQRQQLIALLESVKEQEALSQAAVNEQIKTAASAARTRAYTQSATDPLAPELIKSGRLGSGDVDNLVARLAMEEKRSRKPALTSQDVYKWLGGIAIIVVLLVLIF